MLSAFSNYFYAMFTSNLIESQTNQVTMNDIECSPDVLRDLINYAYCGSININVNNVQSLLQLASLLQINEIVAACSDYMETQLDYTNCINIYYFAQLHNCLKLKQKCREFIDKNIDLIVNSINCDELLNLELDKLIELLESDDLNVKNEEIIVRIIFNWLLFDFEKRFDQCDSVFRLIRFRFLPMDFQIDEFLGNQSMNSYESNKENGSLKNVLEIFKRIHEQNRYAESRKRAGNYRILFSYSDNILL